MASPRSADDKFSVLTQERRLASRREWSYKDILQCAMARVHRNRFRTSTWTTTCEAMCYRSGPILACAICSVIFGSPAWWSVTISRLGCSTAQSFEQHKLWIVLSTETEHPISTWLAVRWRAQRVQAP